MTSLLELQRDLVSRLFSLEGRPLRGPEDLRTHQYYVAVGAERFRVKAYSQWVPCTALIRENQAAQG